MNIFKWLWNACTATYKFFRKNGDVFQDVGDDVFNYDDDDDKGEDDE